MPAARAARTMSTISGSTVAPAIIRSISPSARSCGSPRASARWLAKRSSFIRPSSKAMRALRVSSSWRNASRRRSGATPSVEQNVPNAWNRLVVITPPQSNSRPARRGTPRSGATGQRLRPLGQPDDAVAERLEVGIVAHARRGALEVALHEHHGLPDGQRLVPADVGHRAARAVLVAGDELGARWPALLARDLGELELA